MGCSRKLRQSGGAALLLLALTAALASCANSPRSVSVPAPNQPVAPGHDSPQAAVAGYVKGYENNKAKDICAYVAPPQAGYCSFLIGAKPRNSLTNWRIGNSRVRGDEAIVAVLTDKWCIAKICTGNSDPNQGLPQGNQGFEKAFDKTSNWLPAVSVVRVDGKWYVALA
jgi:hypothetical protein